MTRMLNKKIWKAHIEFSEDQVEQMKNVFRWVKDSGVVFYVTGHKSKRFWFKNKDDAILCRLIS
jgi:hypothetical protein